ncbi:rhodanese-like domain-containing protein [Vineibacter terrae]|uniref:rhodanese-like domain-containing protein n=1 Tax=Vineibacter terrae TaxID=2586908 RepID=UPI002E360E3F|nr:rhodanese-like domain-containing protein [Vineibacter terrae]HEX2888246.1 rhodanese-like domain-containing protein [Vineibacter terrae]
MWSTLKRLLRPTPPITWVACADLADRAGGTPPAVVDVRGSDEFDGPLGHIAGALNVPVDTIMDGTADLAALRSREIVLVCRTDKRSARAADSLAASGFTRVSVLRGGMEQWNALGLPVARGS